MSKRSADKLDKAKRHDGRMLLRLLKEDAADVQTRTIRILASDDSVDSHGTTLNPTGWKLENYLKNPVVLWCHDRHALPVARYIAVALTSRGLEMTLQFATADEYAFADTVFKLIRGGFLNAGSVGFYPLKWKVREGDDVIDIIEQELFEFSIVPVPSNPNALVLAKSAGIDVEPLRKMLGAYEAPEELRSALEKIDAPKAATPPVALNRARRQVDVNRNRLNA